MTTIELMSQNTMGENIQSICVVLGVILLIVLVIYVFYRFMWGEFIELDNSMRDILEDFSGDSKRE